MITETHTSPSADFKNGIRTFLAKTGMSQTAFGKSSVGDPNFVPDVLDGDRMPSLRLVERVLAFMRKHDVSSNSPVSSGSEVPLALCRAAGQPSLGVSSPDCPAPASAVSGALSGGPVGSFAIGHLPSFVDEQEKTTDETQGVAILAQGRA